MIIEVEIRRQTGRCMGIPVFALRRVRVDANLTDGEILALHGEQAVGARIVRQPRHDAVAELTREDATAMFRGAE